MKHFLIAIMGLLLVGCAGIADIQGSLQSRSGELVYLHDSPNNTETQGGTLNIGSFIVDDLLPLYPTVKTTKSFVLPLLVVNMWKYNYESSLGYQQIQNDYKQFMKNSFLEEVKRSCKHKYVEDNGDMEIDVTITAITMSAPIHKNGIFIFLLGAFDYSEAIFAGPVNVMVTANAVLKKDGKEMLRREIHGRSRTGLLMGKNVKLEDYTTTMTEGLSLAIKNLDENIVKEINTI